MSGGHLQINDSKIAPTNIAKIETLQKMLSDARTNTTQDPQILARFLNDIFRAKNQAELKDV